MLVDSNLPVERDRLKNRLIRLIKEDKDILGCFFSGDIASQTEDFFSCIDTRLVVKQDVDIKRKQTDIIHSIGKFLFIEKKNEHFVTINYENFIQLDLHIYTKKQLKPCSYLKNILIIKDCGVIRKLAQQARNINYQITQEEFNQILFDYYGNYFNLYRCWKKKEDNYLESLALSIKHGLISMWYISKGIEPNAVGDWENYQGKRSQLTHLEMNFIQSFTPISINNLELFTKRVEKLMFETAEKISVYNDLFFSIETFKKVHKRISFKQD